MNKILFLVFAIISAYSVSAKQESWSNMGSLMSGGPADSISTYYDDCISFNVACFFPEKEFINIVSAKVLMITIAFETYSDIPKYIDFRGAGADYVRSFSSYERYESVYDANGYSRSCTVMTYIFRESDDTDLNIVTSNDIRWGKNISVMKLNYKYKYGYDAPAMSLFVEVGGAGKKSAKRRTVDEPLADEEFVAPRQVKVAPRQRTATASRTAPAVYEEEEESDSSLSSSPMRFPARPKLKRPKTVRRRY